MGNNSVKVEVRGLELLAAPSPQISALIKEFENKITPIQKAAMEFKEKFDRAFAPMKTQLSKLKDNFKSIFRQAFSWAKSKISWLYLKFYFPDLKIVKAPIPKKIWLPKELFFTFSLKLHAPPACSLIIASSWLKLSKD